MYNAISFVNGMNTWITQAEADKMSADLLVSGVQFVTLPRLQKTFNVNTIGNVGPSQIFLDPLVKGGQFSFSFNGLYAKNGDKEYAFNRGWKLSRGSFSLGQSFDDFIAGMTV